MNVKYNLSFLLCQLVLLILISDKSSGQLEVCNNFVTTLDFDTLQVGNKKMVYFAHERTWDEAVEECKKVGMRLVSITNEEENKALYKYFMSRASDEINPYLFQIYWYVWSSGSDAGHEGHYVWKSTGQNVTYTAWSDNEPNGGGRENCIELRYTYNGKLHWNDSICSIRKRYICETDHVNQLEL